MAANEIMKACSDRVKVFFDHWKLYQKVMGWNYLSHQEAYAVLAAFLADHFSRSFSFLDLGSGDAAHTGPLLKTIRLEAYGAIDLSEKALETAKQNTLSLECPKKFWAGNLKEAFGRMKGPWDFIWMGLSLHHLTSEEKELFLRESRARIKPEGFLMAYDPMRLEGEDRKSFLARWRGICQNHWTELSEDEKQGMYDHVAASDFPETASDLKRMGTGQGFSRVERLFEDRYQLHQMICFYPRA